MCLLAARSATLRRTPALTDACTEVPCIKGIISWSCSGLQRVCAVAGEAEENELANFTPAFLWLLRDFYLTLEEDGRQACPRSPQCQNLQEVTCMTGSAKRIHGSPHEVLRGAC